MLLLADIDLDVLRTVGLADDHAGINLFAGSDEEGSTVLCSEETIGNGDAGLKCNEGTVFTECDISLVRLIAVEHGIDNAGTLRHGHEVATETDQSTGRNPELQTGETGIDGTHVPKLSLSLGESGDDGSGILIRNIDIGDLDGLGLLSILIGMEDDFGL